MIPQHSSKTNEWFTPPAIIEMARLVMGSIDTDPASCEFAQSYIKAAYWAGAEPSVSGSGYLGPDGLKFQWSGNVWMNPPYGKRGNRGLAGIFVAELLEQYADGNVTQAIGLVNANTSSNWFRPLWGFPICFCYDRIKFIDVNGVERRDPPNSNAIFYLGPNIEKCKNIFGGLGYICL